MNSFAAVLPRGIVSVVQTAFTADDRLDLPSVGRLVRDAVEAGVNGLLVPAVASEVAFLRPDERDQLVRTVVQAADGRAPVILGASAPAAKESLALIAAAEGTGVSACLVAVPPNLCGNEPAVVDFFRPLAARLTLPLIIQDLQFDGPGLSLECVHRLRELLPSLAGLKIETVPAGPKYTAVRAACGKDFWVAGGWAVPQMIEALDRGVDAMVPESSMIRVYQAIVRLHREGRRDDAKRLFQTLLPLLTFSNQEIATSVAFFKRLLCRKKLFSCPHQRMPLPAWDLFSEQRTQELIDEYQRTEAGLRPVGNVGTAPPANRS